MFQVATGYKIHWRKLQSSAEATALLASGEVQITPVGAVAIAKAIQKDPSFRVFWIIEDIASSEA